METGTLQNRQLGVVEPGSGPNNYDKEAIMAVWSCWLLQMYIVTYVIIKIMWWNLEWFFNQELLKYNELMLNDMKLNLEQQVKSVF